MNNKLLERSKYLIKEEVEDKFWIQGNISAIQSKARVWEERAKAEDTSKEELADIKVKMNKILNIIFVEKV